MKLIRLSLLILACITLLVPKLSFAMGECNYRQFNASPQSPEQWHSLNKALLTLMPHCLRNSQYFALLGAAQLNSGQLSSAMESLERALLIDPENGSALLDYSEALFLTGQLFAAIQMNERLLQTAQLPPHLDVVVKHRQREWTKHTKRKTYRLGLQGGFDSNLNSAPNLDNVTLTLPDQNIRLAISKSSQPMSGLNTKFHLSSYHQMLAPDEAQSIYLAFNSRNSPHHPSNLAQIEGHYTLDRTLIQGTLTLNSHVSQLYYGGERLYDQIEAGAQYQLRNRACRPFVSAKAQLQHYPKQNELNGLEAKASVGNTCTLHNGIIETDISLLANHALDQQRAGGDRHGLQARAMWLTPLFKGQLSSEVTFTQLEDSKAYSQILEKGATRTTQSLAARVQYTQPISKQLNFTLAFYHQQQDSNINLFQHQSSAIDVGFNWLF